MRVRARFGVRVRDKGRVGVRVRVSGRVGVGASLGIGSGLGLGSRGRATVVVAEHARVEGGGHQDHL